MTTGRIGREALLARVVVATGAALDANLSKGYEMLLRMGWREGEGLGPRGRQGALVPAAVDMAGLGLVEGVGVGFDSAHLRQTAKGEKKKL